MSYLAQRDALIQSARGAFAQGSGLPYNVFRLGSGASGSILSGSPTIAGFSASLEKAERESIEGNPFELLTFIATCDNRALAFGDMLVGTDPRDSATYAYAQCRPTRETIFVRTEYRVSIYRPAGSPEAAPGATAASPGAPYVVSSFVSDNAFTRQVLTLTSGVWSFAPEGATPASVPAAIVMTARAGGPRLNALPTSTTTARFVGYLPPLPGITLLQNDIVFLDEDRQLVVNSALADDVGLIGTVLVLEQSGL